MKAILIAAAAHTINAGLCRAFGDLSQPVWDEAPEWQQQSALAGVQMHLANPDATPEQSHESWMAQKIADGWVYGEAKDPEAKTHPCMVPYSELPVMQQAKDHVFKAVVHALKDIPDSDDSAAEVASLQAEINAALAQLAAVPADAQVMGVAVQYIGPRESYTDRLYGSGLMFSKGQVRSIPGEIARRLLKHADLFTLVSTEAPVDRATAAELAEKAADKMQKERKEEDLAALHREVDNFADFSSLASFAKDRYQMDLVKQRGLEKSRAEVHARIDQFGAV